ncbi:hypothetical protein PQS31_06125 [Luteimonas sp BLCC-B24]|uniref:hypothetical protein n=1 Tax=Luteimonas sp. BLCC-B24 TaxID=3025317 RepID=UPI00234D576B|nr:hypothetical protein [Luteimonas sp. BLCC-B24]MDC7806400.1 hypothetical protein [Luteimonas sp. BLCC-B24]
MRDKVSQLRKLLGEATPSPRIVTNDAEGEAWRRFQQFEAYSAPAPLESSWRAIAAREITRIAAWYGWTSEIQRTLDETNVDLLSALSDEDLTRLRNRMRHLEDNAKHGLGAPDAPPAT